MITSSITRLQYLIEIIPIKLKTISNEDFNYKPSPTKWSKKEILGHLIDSATNNHHRFIRAQYENIPKICYDQDQWNSLSNYNQLDDEHVINFWTIYNKHLIEILKSIKEENLSKECNTGGDTNFTLEWLIEDYIVHLEHHLKQITEY
ncbi:MAG: hypothetical protein HW421_1978 [Ignavibacteria bacterium]|nr:hypothetical protein [Ignavibacteria bacterium]